jgi:hypothetical protein
VMSIGIVGSLGNGAAAADPLAVSRALAPFQGLQLLLVASSTVSAVVLYGAIFRASFFPDDRAFLYLRLGRRELWMGLTFLALMAIYTGAIFAMMIPFFILIVIVAVAAGAGSSGAAGAVGVGLLIGIPLVIAAMVVILWGAMRLSLSMPMAFAQNGFRLTEGWKLTKGHGWRIFVVMLAIGAMVLVVELVLIGVGAGLISLITPFSELGRIFTGNPAELFSKVNPGIWAVIVLLWALLGGWAVTMISAALAEIYRGLAGPDTASVFD